MVSAASGVIALVPGMPIFPFAALAGAAGALAWRRSQQPPGRRPSRQSRAEAKEEPISAGLAIDDVKLELGYGLLT